MLRKSTLLRLLCLTLLTVLGSFGVFNATAQPAQALFCFPKFLGCNYDGIEDYGNVICCRYHCSDGSYKIGVCEQV